MSKRVLVVDDEPAIVTLLEYNLAQAGYEVLTASDGQAALETALAEQLDFIILDLMLPKLDGIEVLKRLRQEKNYVPVLILTAKESEYDRVIGLELGADDYVTKPFSPREIIARLKAISRRGVYHERAEEAEKQKPSGTLTFGGVAVDLANYKVEKQGQPLKLTPKEFKLLAYFVERPNRVVTREDLLASVWGFDYTGQSRMVDMHVSNLREKIEPDPKHPQYLQTVRGFGYRFNPAGKGEA